MLIHTIKFTSVEGRERFEGFVLLTSEATLSDGLNLVVKTPRNVFRIAQAAEEEGFELSTDYVITHTVGH